MNRDHNSEASERRETVRGTTRQADDRSSKQPKKDRERTRVSRACDRCKARKTRCSGRWPCVFCSQLNLECRFTASYRRGHVPAVHIDSGNKAHPTAQVPEPGSDHGPRNGSVSSTTVASPTASLAGGLGNGAERRWSRLGDQVSVSTANPGLPESHGGCDTQPGLPQQPTQALDSGPPAAQSARNSPERAQTDQQGHYVGPASGVSFLLRVQRKLQQQSPGSSGSSIFTFGDLPLPGPESPFVILPPKSQADGMVRRYFDFVSVTHRFLHRPTVEGWLEELYETNGTKHSQKGASSRIALLFLIFAHSTSLSSRRPTDTNVAIAKAAEASAQFFAAAENQPSEEKGEIQLTSVQARLAQCFFLLGQSRLNHCWTLFGITAHLVLALGIHRRSGTDLRRRRPGTDTIDYVDLECRKRTFWCAYNLNTYLSATLGRPMTFHDEDIDQELPLCVDDFQLHKRQVSPPPTGGQSILSASVAQHRLSRIVSRVLRDLYGIRPPSTEDYFRLAKKFGSQLDDWHRSMSYLLATEGNSAVFVKLVLRQRDVLKLAFWHVQALVHRPFLLDSFVSLANYSTNDALLASRGEELLQNVRKCLEAAIQIVQLIDRIDAAGELYSTLFFIPYYGFSAVVVLYVYAIQQRQNPPDSYISFFQSASKCHARIQNIAAKGSLMQRYGVVLQELRLEVLQHNAFLASVATPDAGGHVQPSSERIHGSPLTRKSPGLSQWQRRPGSYEMPGRQEATPERRANVQAEAGGSEIPMSAGYGPMSAEEDGNLARVFGTDSAMLHESGRDANIAQAAGWSQFDSLVTGGAEIIEAFFPDASVHT